MTIEIPVDRIRSGLNDRKHFDLAALEQLAANIEELGLLQAIVVRPVTDDPAIDYELIAGERRWRATCLLGRPTITATVRDASDLDAALAMLAENDGRIDLNDMERAEKYRKLIDEHGLTIEEIARGASRKPGFVRDRLALLALDPAVQNAIRSGAVPHSLGLRIADLDHNRQMTALRDYLAHPEWSAQRFDDRVLELRGLKLADDQVSMFDTFELVTETYRLDEVKPNRKVGAVGLAQLLELVLDHHEDGITLPDALVAVIRKAVDDHLGTNAVMRREAAQRAWLTMRTDKQEKAG
jgi:ParB/RepB/Spo0J family partition protein